MKFIKFWKIEVKQLTLTEKMFFRDAIKTLFTWEVIKEEYPDLDLIMRILESEIQNIISEVETDKKSGRMTIGMKSYSIDSQIKQISV